MSNCRIVELFNGGVPSIVISDDEGNPRDEEYASDPWSGLSYRVQHTYEDNKGCPIAAHGDDGGTVGVYLYDSLDEVVQAWNTRKG